MLELRVSRPHTPTNGRGAARAPGPKSQTLNLTKKRISPGRVVARHRALALGFTAAGPLAPSTTRCSAVAKVNLRCDKSSSPPCRDKRLIADVAGCATARRRRRTPPDVFSR